MTFRAIAVCACAAVLAGAAAGARTFEIAAWRGETLAARVPDSCELGGTPDGISVRRGVLKGVKYAPGPGSLQRLECLDRVEWDSDDGSARVVEVTVPSDAKPGVYKCGMMSVRVVDRVLPPAKEWKYYLDLWQHPWAVARMAGVEPFSKEHYEAMRPVWELLASAGQKALTVTILEEPWDHQCFDAYHSMIDGDFRLFDEYVEFGRSCGIGPDISCYTVCPWREKEKPGTPEYEARWAPFIRKFAAHLKEKGWFEDTLISMDERSPEDVRKIAEFIRTHAPGMRIAMAGNRKPSDFKGIDIDVYSQILSHVTEDFLAEIPERRAKGFVTTHYVCCAPLHPNTFMWSPDGEQFYCGVYPALVGLDGFLRWAWNSWPKDPARDASYGNWASGDTFLVYPGGAPSWRFLELRNGIVAAEKIRILSESAEAHAKVAEIVRNYGLDKPADQELNFRAVRKEILSLVNRQR